MAIVTLLLVAAAILVAHHSQATQGPVERSLSSDSGQALLSTELRVLVDTADASDENEAAYLMAGGMTVIVGCLAGLFILGVRAWFGRVVPCLSSTGDRVLGPTTSSAPRRIIGWLRPAEPAPSLSHLHCRDGNCRARPPTCSIISRGEQT